MSEIDDLLEPPVARTEPVPEFTPVEREELTRAIHLGRAYKEVTVLGHVVSLKTLTVNEELQVARIIKRDEDNKGWQRAFMAACVAASIERIDQQPLYTPLNEDDKNNLIQRKFEKISEYYPVFVDQVYGEFRKLEQETTENLLPKLGKSQG